MERFIRGYVTNKAQEKRMLELDLENINLPKPVIEQNLIASEEND
jgi:hypothetical protein